MNKKILALIAIGILLFVLMNFVSAPGKNIEIKDKRNEHISVASGATFCVERTLGSKETAKAVMAPLFSDGLTLESIDLKKTVTETYTVNVPDYGTCSRNVETAVNSTGCSSPCSYKNNTCICTATENYSCVTGSHPEMKTRETVSYLPVTDGSYESNKPDKNIKENEVENRRAMLPEKLKGLKQIGHSKEFDFTGNATVSICFKAPDEGSGITSGTISYLGYNSLDYDYEGSTAVNTYPYKMSIDCSSLANGVPIVINGSNGFSSLHGQNCGKQIVWTYCSGTGTALYYNNCTDYGVWNGTDQLPMEVEQGTGTSYQSASIWKDYGLVWHLSGSVADSTGKGHTGTTVGNPNFNPQIIGKSANLSSTTTNQYISTGDHSDYSGLKEITAELWINMTTFGLQAVDSFVLFKDPEYDIEGGYSACTTAGIGWRVFSGSAWSTVACYPFSKLSQNNVYFITATHNGTTLRLYINGTLAAEVNQTIAMYDGTGGLYVGVHSSATYPFPSIYDEVRISNVSMSATRINQIYQNGIGASGYGTIGSEVVIGSQSSGTTAAIKSDTGGNIVLNPASGGKVKIAVSITDGANEITVANAKAAYDHSLQDSVKSVSEWQQQCTSCVNGNDVNANEVQKRVQNTCNGTQAVNSIGTDGVTGCVNVGTGGGGITSCNACDSTFVNEGQANSITSGMIASMDWSKLQNYPAGCPAGQFISVIGNIPTCAVPAGGGTITAVNSGVGTKGGATSGAATIEFACSEVAGAHVNCTGETINVNDDWVKKIGDVMSGDLVIGTYSIKSGNNYIQIDNSALSNEMDFKSKGNIVGIADGDVKFYAGGPVTTKSCYLKATDGSWNCAGAKNAEIYVPEINETVYMHAIEGDEVLHVMKGTAQLNKGNLTIILPEKFQYVISENSTPNVQVTPLGKCSLYVSNKKWNAFTVESFAGDTGCKFDWIVFATRRGYEDIEIEKSGTVIDKTSYCNTQKKIEKQDCIDRFDKHKKEND